MEFKILGPVEVTVRSQRLDLGGPRQQMALATLLLNVGRVVTVGTLLEAIYGEELPPTARSQAQIAISALRRLFASHGYEQAISTRPHGYVIDADAGQLDARRFDDLVRAARSARDTGQLDLAVARYRDGQRLWRGPALDGLESQLVQAAASRLDELRIATNEERLELELDLGRHHELTGELTELVGQYPLREQLRGQLMLALYRSGRTADALAVYRQTRQLLIDELGIEPSGRLRQLEHAVLTADPALDLPPDPVRLTASSQPVPGLLPADIADFTGRTEQITQIYQRLIPAPGEEPRLAVPVVVIVGKGGVGKTTVAVHAAHGAATHFPDGQLYANLRGGAASPIGPAQILERFLRVLGVTGSQIPDGLDERAEVYRNLLARRRMLVVLDDAADESQVSPLLPGSGAAAVMLTSRTRLAGIGGATHIEVNVLDPAQSVDLLGRIVGGDRVTTQPQAAAEVAEQCGHLPLALRIAGARLAARPHWSTEQLAERLADETRRLDELTHGDMGVRASISLTYEGSPEQARRLLCRLALLEFPVFTSWFAAPLLDLPPIEAENVLDNLVSAHLVEATGTGSGPGSHYRLHELIRVFARERLLAEEPAADRAAALERALAALVYLAEAARSRHFGGEYLGVTCDVVRWPLPEPLVERLVADPLAWYDHERAIVVAAIKQAARAGFIDLSWKLALTVETFIETRACFDDLRAAIDAVLPATVATRNVKGNAAILYASGTMNMQLGRYEQSRADLEEATGLFTSIGDAQGVAQVGTNLAFIDRMNGRFTDAVERFERALATFRRTGDHINAAYVLLSLARIKLELDEFDPAIDLLGQALRLSQEAGSVRSQAQGHYLVGETHLRAGDLPSALDGFELALVKATKLGDPIGQAHILRGIGIAKLRQGEFGPARSALKRSLELGRQASDRLAEAQALLGLSELALASGDASEAVTVGEQARAAFEALGAPVHQARALNLIAQAQAALG